MENSAFLQNYGGYLLFAAFLVLAYAYWRGLRWIRARAITPEITPAPRPAVPDALSSDELGRYARHITLRDIGGAGQMKLRKASVLVIGAGGLGCPALMYLAAAGIGRIGIVDDDAVSLSNLQRQVLFETNDIGRAKVDAAKDRLCALNPHIHIDTHKSRLMPKNADNLLSGYDLVLDGCDNFETRHVVNAAAIRAQIPFVSGAISQWEGQVAVFHPAETGPCYACLFPQAPEDTQSCATAGVVGALPGVIGSMMALEAVKLITASGPAPYGAMLIYDGLYAQMRRIKIQKNHSCFACK